LIQFRRFAAFLVGAWLAGSLFMDVTAIVNFHAVERFLADPGIPAAQLIHGAGHENVRVLLRRAAGEANGWLFEQWEWIQLVTGLALLLVFIFGNRPPKVPIALCLLMMILVLVERFALTPNIVRLGRIIDFLPNNTQSPDRAQFSAYHGAYAILEIVKVLIGFAIAGILIIRRQPDPQMFAREAELAQEDLPPRRNSR
jgi:hypothetical protein